MICEAITRAELSVANEYKKELLLPTMSGCPKIDPLCDESRFFALTVSHKNWQQMIFELDDDEMRFYPADPKAAIQSWCCCHFYYK